ncbi:CFI-box-CTERM domain-containing protein [Paenibacillus sp. CCS19]|uniref:CFI-box-CTERM domain-containing protein n=1 Tax=Paenibacillus sp. CCS19 TaxID=3158387 RepID=UPI00295E3054|nr:CFI-box-CTERM domain-containing protein [Paenibacillus cellulosilyticus]
MFFKTSEAHKEGLPLQAVNADLKKRWSVFTPNNMNLKTKTNWKWFNNVLMRKGERTKLHLGFDNTVGRPVIIKTVFYRPEDLANQRAIKERRQVLLEQIRILNKIVSPLLPEPLDWFKTQNTVDSLPDELRDSEPVLILDFLPGTPLSNTIKSKKMRFSSSREEVDFTRVGRIAIKLLQFLRVLNDNGYAFLDFNPEHILLLKNDIPRFIGIGSICDTTGKGTLNENHVNFWRTSKGYSAPELLDHRNDWVSAKQATSAQIAAFSLGVIIHQMVYEDTAFTKEMIKDGSFLYPNGVSEEKIMKEPKGKEIHDLICKLCEHDPGKRLTDLEKIEKNLHDLAGSVNAKFNAKKKEMTFRSGTGEAAAGLETKPKPRPNPAPRNEPKPEPRPVPPRPVPRPTPEQPRPIPPRPNPRPVPKPQPPKKDGWCFISTAAYGSATHGNLDTLRWFRDHTLRQVSWGRDLLAHYARTSPKISHLLRGMPVRKHIVRFIIDMSVWSARKVRKQSEETGSVWGLWFNLSLALYFAAFSLSYLFVLPEKLLGIQTTSSRGENE